MTTRDDYLQSVLTSLKAAREHIAALAILAPPSPNLTPLCDDAYTEAIPKEVDRQCIVNAYAAIDDAETEVKVILDMDAISERALEFLALAEWINQPDHPIGSDAEFSRKAKDKAKWLLNSIKRQASP